MYVFEQTLLYAIPFFAVLMTGEYLYGLWRGNNTMANKSDVISSLMSGLTSILSNTIGFGFLIISYEWMHTHFALTSVESNQLWVWVMTFLVMDCAAYWVHRWAHENNFLWTMHVIHHSSETYNLPVALRQNAFKWVSYRPLIMVPIALIGVPVEIVAIMTPIHLFSQYWYHTQHIGKLGFLEKIIMTPALHRVHHAINDIYIDKNYSAILCVWDRMFGTYQEELDDEPPVYGCLGPVHTWDPMKIELRQTGRLIRDAIYTKRWSDKLRVFFSHTGWRPADVAERFPGRYIDDYKNFQRYQPPVPSWIEWWGLGELIFVTLSAMYLFANIAAIAPNSWLLFSFVAAALLGVHSLAALLEGNVGWIGALGRAAVYGGVYIQTSSLYELPTLAMAVAGAYVLLTFAVRAQRQVAISSGQPTVNGQINAAV